jgi:large subunit ribosomal protein L19
MTKTATVISPVNIEARKAMDIRPGDTIRVHQKIKEADGKSRIQVFEGIVLARKHGAEAGGTITVRRVSGGFGVEKIFPIYSPAIDKIELVKRSKVRRAKLYHVRDKAAREIKRQMRRMQFMDETMGADAVVEAPVEAEKEAEQPVENK